MANLTAHAGCKELARAQLEQLFVAICQDVRNGFAMERMNKIATAAFALTLRKAREQAELTQEDLAERADVSVRFISFLETGKRQPSLSAIVAISAGLGMKMSELIERVEEQLKYSGATEP